MSRRFTIAALFPLTLLALGCDSPDRYVLVHGAWMGAEAWDGVAAELRDEGDEVVAVSLPGHGADGAPTPGLDLAAYVDEVVRAIDDQDGPVILVGHSMAGIVISQAAEARPDAIAELVYVAAYLPADGQSLLDLANQDAGSMVGEHLVFHDDGTVGIEDGALGEVFCADCEPDALAALQAQYRPEPGAPLGEPVSLSAARFGSVPRAYVKTLRDQVVSPGLQDLMLDGTGADRVIEIDTSHAPMLAAPAELSAVLRSR